MRADDDDITRRIDMEGNSRSDDLAKQARRDYVPARILKLADYLTWRIHHYTLLVASIHKIIVRMHLAAQQLRAQPAFLLQHPLADRRRTKLLACKILTYPVVNTSQQDDSITLTCTTTQTVVDSYLSSANSLMQGMWKFLTQCRFSNLGPQQPGCTWPELLLFATI